MKLLKTIAVCALVFTTLGAADAVVKPADVQKKAGEFDLKLNMLKLSENLQNLQDSFITGDIKNATKFAIELDSLNKTLFANADAVKKMLPKGKEKYANTAMSYSKNIDKFSTAMLDGIHEGKYDKAQGEFLAVMRSCMNCHNIVRDWGKEVK